MRMEELSDQHKPLEFPENRDKMIEKAIEADEETGGYCAAGNPDDMPLGEALVTSLTELRDALAENPDLGVGQELRRILLAKGYTRITLREARDLALKNLLTAEKNRRLEIDREAELDTWSDDGGQ